MYPNPSQIKDLMRKSCEDVMQAYIALIRPLEYSKRSPDNLVLVGIPFINLRPLFEELYMFCNGKPMWRSHSVINECVLPQRVSTVEHELYFEGTE